MPLGVDDDGAGGSLLVGWRSTRRRRDAWSESREHRDEREKIFFKTIQFRGDNHNRIFLASNVAIGSAPTMFSDNSNASSAGLASHANHLRHDGTLLSRGNPLLTLKLGSSSGVPSTQHNLIWICHMN